MRPEPEDFPSRAEYMRAYVAYLREQYRLTMGQEVSSAGYATGANADAPRIMVLESQGTFDVDASDASWSNAKVTWAARLWDDGLVEEFIDGEWVPV